MPNKIYDADNPLPASGTNALLELAGTGSALIDLAVTSDTLTAIQVANTHSITIGKHGSAIGKLYGLQFLGAGSRVYNEGTIQSNTGTAIIFAEAGANSVINFGTIIAKNIAVEGNSGDDRVVNAGSFRTTSVTGALLIDLKNGRNFYDGVSGSYLATQGTLSVTIKGGTGDDTFYGAVGGETFVGGTGTNIMNGGGSNATDANQKDTVDYSWATTALNVSLERTSSQWTGVSSDLLLNIENLIGSGFSDTLTGDIYTNVLRGGAGNDTLEGGYGDDVLDGGSGENETNTARYSGSSAVKVDLRILTAQNTGSYGSDILSGIANLEGGSGADEFIGNDKNNQLVGNGGIDTLNGGVGNDTLQGGSGADILIGGAGNDTLDGGSGEDTAEFSGNRASYTWSVNPDGSYTITGQDGTDVLKDIRILKFADTKAALSNANPSSLFLSSSSLSESAVPGKVADIYGSDPDGDTMTYTLDDSAGGLFSINGDELILTRPLDYELAKQHVISIKATDPYGGEVIKKMTLNVRNVTETTPLTLSGTKGSDTLSGEAGNDRLSGLSGNDSLYGNDGADTLVGSAGNDAMFGGAGKDVFIFDAKPNVKTNVEYLYDFNVAEDTIHLKLSAFKGIGRKGALSKAAFWTGDKVHDSSDHIIYNKKTGALFFDPDGTGAKAAIQMASLPRKLSLTHKDFLII